MKMTEPCDKCRGTGEMLYGSTSTYMGGIGGAAMTTDVCNKCWGTGLKNKTGVNLKELRLEMNKSFQLQKRGLLKQITVLQNQLNNVKEV